MRWSSLDSFGVVLLVFVWRKGGMDRDGRKVVGVRRLLVIVEVEKR